MTRCLGCQVFKSVSPDARNPVGPYLGNFTAPRDEPLFLVQDTLLPNSPDTWHKSCFEEVKQYGWHQEDDTRFTFAEEPLAQ